MTAFYELVKDEEFNGATIFVGGEAYTVASDNPAWLQIREHILNDVDDDEKLVAMITPAVSAAGVLQRLTERVTFDGSSLYFDGDALDNALADHIVKIIESGAEAKDYTSFALFLEKLASNPSKKSRKHLYAFIAEHGMTIADDGDLIAYKGVKADGGSINQGYGIVDGVVVKNGSLQNNVGSVIEIPRSMVDDDRNVGCSTGLHAGTYDYAKSFSQGLLLTVKVNPRDVVSVPKDCSNAKIRTARYSVLETTSTKIETLTYGNAAEPEPEDDDFALSTYEEADPDEGDADIVSDDVLADALAEAFTKSDDEGGSVSVTVTYTPSTSGRGAGGKFVKGGDNPGKTQARDAHGHFLPKK